jgi:hypothetical protein
VNVDFIVLGLPRSGTTWLANWLTTDTTVCLHDPFRLLPEQWPRDGRTFGVSCTGGYLMPKWLDAQTCPVAVIERDPADCDASLARMGMGSVGVLAPELNRVRARRWRFADLWNETSARDLWAFLLPNVRFDAVRYRLLRDMQVQPHPRTWTPDLDVVRALHTRGLLPQENTPCLGA